MAISAVKFRIFSKITQSPKKRSANKRIFRFAMQEEYKLNYFNNMKNDIHLNWTV